MRPIRQDLAAWRRVPFGGATGDMDIAVIGMDWSTAVFALQLRAAPGEEGGALISLGVEPAGTQGISATYADDYPYPANGPNAALVGELVGATMIRLQIDRASLSALPFPQDDPAAPLELFYDLRITPSGEPERLMQFGKMIIYPGVTI